MALVSGVAHYVLLQILGIPYAPVLGVWVGLISQFVPTIGTYLAGALPMLVAFTVNPWYAMWVLAFVVVYQQFENYVLQPKLTSKTVDIHPALAFGSVIAGSALLGAVGAIIAIPAVATLQAFLGAYVRRYDVLDDPLAPAARSRGGDGGDGGDPRDAGDAADAVDSGDVEGGDGRGGAARSRPLLRRVVGRMRSPRRDQDPARGRNRRQARAAPVPEQAAGGRDRASTPGRGQGGSTGADSVRDRAAGGGSV